MYQTDHFFRLVNSGETELRSEMYVYPCGPEMLFNAENALKMSCTFPYFSDHPGVSLSIRESN